MLRDAIFPLTPIKAGMQLSFTLHIRNVGYASPYNARAFRLIMRNKSTKQEFAFNIDTDVRKWFTGLSTINAKVVTDNTMAAGDYDLFLFLPDAAESLSARPEYALRLANENVWEDASGYNSLNKIITVN